MALGLRVVGVPAPTLLWAVFSTPLKFSCLLSGEAVWERRERVRTEKERAGREEWGGWEQGRVKGKKERRKRRRERGREGRRGEEGRERGKGERKERGEKGRGLHSDTMQSSNHIV